MNLNPLIQFLAVAEHRSITSAAQALSLTQSALTKSMKRLEDDLSIRLLHRLPRGIDLTREGEILAERVRLANLEIEHGLAEIEAMTSAHRSTLRIGGTPVWTTSVIPQALAEIAVQQPAARFTITMGMPETLLDQLRRDELDVAALGVEVDLPDEFAYERLGSFDQVVFARNAHPLRAEDVVAFSELPQLPWIVFDRDPDAVERILRLSQSYQAHPAAIVARSSSLATIMGLVSRGDFLFAGPDILTDFARSFGISPLPTERLWSLPAGIIYRTVGRKPLLLALLRAMRSVLNESPMLSNGD